MSYVIRNCPAYNYDEEFNYHICKQSLVPYECSVDDCKDCINCLIKQIYEDVKTLYQTPEYFETIKDEQQLLIESAWHNVAHMVISKLEIMEVE